MNAARIYVLKRNKDYVLRILKLLVLLTFNLTLCNQLIAQTSWTGTDSEKWDKSDNWTAGVPDINTSAIIGDANFTGPHQPGLNKNDKCKGITIGNGAIACTLTVSKNLTVIGDVVIGANGVILADTKKKTITLEGDWINNGSYDATDDKAVVTFSGSNQSITGATTFGIINVNSSSNLTLIDDISIDRELNASESLF